MHIIQPSFHILDELDQQDLMTRIECCGRICYKSEHRIEEDSAQPFVRKIIDSGHHSVLEMAVLTLQVHCPDPADIVSFFLCQPKYLQIDRIKPDQLLITGSIRAFREIAALHPENALIQAMISFLAALQPDFFAAILSGAQTSEYIRITHLPPSALHQFDPPLQAKHSYLAVRFVVNRAVTHELVRHRPCAFLQESQRYCRYSSDRFGNEVTFIRPLFFEQNGIEFATWKKAMEQAEQSYLQLLQTSSPQAARTVLPNSCKTEIIVYTNLQEWRHILKLRATSAADPSMQEVMIPLQKELQSRFPHIFL